MAENDADQTADGNSETATDSGDTGRTFTEAEVEKLVRDRLGADRKRRSEHPGISNSELSSLQAKAEKFDELEAKNKTELEKATERIAAAERERDEALKRAQEQTLRTEIIGAASGKLADPTDAVALIDRSAIDFNKDGSPTNIGELVTTLLEAKPHLAAGGARGTSADQGARGTAAGQITREMLKTMSPEQIHTAQMKGQLDHLLKG